MRCKHLDCNGNILSDGKCLQCGRSAFTFPVYKKISVEQNTRDHKTTTGTRVGQCQNCLISKNRKTINQTNSTEV